MRYSSDREHNLDFLIAYLTFEPSALLLLFPVWIPFPMLVCCSEVVSTRCRGLMERYLLCGEILSVPQSSAVYKGRKRGTVEFYAIHKHDKAAKHRITNGVIDVGTEIWIQWCKELGTVQVVMEELDNLGMGEVLKWWKRGRNF